MLFDEDGLKKAGGRFLPCPMCGKREWLKVRVATKYDFHYMEKKEYFSIRCEDCKLTYGEENGEPIYESESALIADWNRRAY
jgi:predicted nucleic-acid-binding Zn-ribbon protein